MILKALGNKLEGLKSEEGPRPFRPEYLYNQLAYLKVKQAGEDLPKISNIFPGMKCIKFSGSLRYKQITKSCSEIRPRSYKFIKENLPSNIFLPFQWTAVKIKEIEKIDKFFDFAREMKRGGNDGDNDTNYGWCTWNVPEKLGKGIGEIENLRKTIEESWRPVEMCSHLEFSGRQHALTSEKKLE